MSLVGENVVIDQNVYIGSNVKIGNNVRIMWGTWIGDNVEIGESTIIYPGCSIGSPAEHKTAKPPPDAGVIIGRNCTIREFTTINSNVLDHKTRIMDDCYVMTKSYVGHDCVVHDNAVMCAGSKLAGHVIVGSYTYLGINACVHQHSKIGSYCMIGAQSFFKGESPDAITWVGVPARPLKVNARSLDKNIHDPVMREKMIESANSFIDSRRSKCQLS